ncbi:ergothioneine biosynthesis protein EgtB [Kaistella antarctica]|uniref:Iron(II)-dependent oxidoreductase EgtB n=1 Tax=Kaistella antarctica TaxID=266748 RepID=A0A448NT61_9FLAO|nr:ergothioneine biosynthesis protein EgtB [Kaistella antarctica]KEY18043.1 sulfatase maturase [Kaistella antarctica]SEV82304.1 ergothioneine biosynthesis protein EgtB [Kaistella antarctica]VEI00576.1 Iron(II)-dependent oxidoreductase EgtB [Kaistella antarctica]
MSELLQLFQNTRAQSVALCEPLHIEDYLPQPVDFASPPKWHLSHSTWFFEEMVLKKFVTDYKIFNPHFSFLFNSYYQTIGERAIRTERGTITRPTVAEVYEYRKYVDAHIKRLLQNAISPELEELIILGVNHEQQHQELLITDLKHTFSYNPIHPVYKENFNLTAQNNEEDGWLQISEGIYKIGFEGEGFHFDNEKGRHKVFLHDFEISKFLVTNADFLEFMEVGGYDNFKFWLDEGWNWVNENQIKSPLYWTKIDGDWHSFTLEGLKPIEHDDILTHISFYEAQAFACWKGLRLPTEFEWEAAADQLNWGKRWEWTYSAYLPYPNFQIAEGAVGEYNGKFMVSQMVLRGASTATPKGHERKTYRNFFHPKHRWQVTGIRLAK